MVDFRRHGVEDELEISTNSFRNQPIYPRFALAPITSVDAPRSGLYVHRTGPHYLTGIVSPCQGKA